MATTEWTGGNGNWTDPTWTDGIPDSTINAIIDGATANPVTVTFNSPSGAALSLDTDNATLAVTSGALSLGAASTLDAITQSGGLLDFAAGGTITGPISETGGTLENDSGTLALDGGATLGGTIAGGGEIESVNTGSGTTTISGLIIANSVTYVSAGNGNLPAWVNQKGLLTIGDSSGGATVVNRGGAEGTWNLASSTADIVAGAGSNSTFINDGELNDEAAGTVAISIDFVDNGVVQTTKADQTLLFSGGSFTNNNNVSAFDGKIIIGPGVTNRNFAGGTLAGKGIWQLEGGTVSMAGDPITALGGHAWVDLAYGGEIGASGSGTFTPIQQSLTMIADGAFLGLATPYTFTKALTDNGELSLFNATFSDRSALRVGTTGVLTAFGTGSNPTATVAAPVLNAGTIIADNADLSAVTLNLTRSLISSGTLEADARSVIDISGPHNVIAGRFASPGEIMFSGGTTTIANHASGFVHTVGLSAGATLVTKRSIGLNTFNDIASGGTSTVDLTGHMVDVTNSSFEGGALIDGGGTFTGAGTMALGGLALDGGTALVNSSLANQTGAIALGDASGGTASIVNRSGATWTMSGATSIAAASATADTITNAGSFEKTGSGTAVVGAAFTNTGTIEVTSGTLEITAPFINTGEIIGTEIQSGGTTFITAPVTLLNQYAAALASPGASLSPSFAHPPAPTHAILAAPHAG